MPKPLRIDVREATAADLTFLAEAHRLGHRAIEGERGGALDIALRGRPEPIEASFAEALDDPDTTVRIGEVDSVSAGYLSLTLQTLRSNEVIAAVTDLWVHPNARGVGVGARLMRSASSLAEANGCIGIDARALPGDRITKNFFESFGLVARTIEVHKALS